jgi:Ni,Fe-hydrogenase III large subunit
MPIHDLGLNLTRLAAPVATWHAPVDRVGWSTTSAQLASSGARLVAVWGTHGASSSSSDRGAVNAALAGDFGLLWMELALPAGEQYPDLTPSFACAPRMQRTVADLNGLQAEGARDRRPWLDHGLWRDDRPLTAGALPRGADAQDLPADYAFVRVEGDGVHEIPVGPVHAGIIEPGHFRFSVVGEKVLRLEQRLGYVHKGIEHRFSTLHALEGHRLAGRISGDSTVAYAWAYGMALESAAGVVVPVRAAWLRALLLERERVANHLGDLGALGNDAALAFGLSQFSRLREDWQRLSRDLFGHRFMMDAVVPGGVAFDLDASAAARVRAQCDAIEREVRTLRGIYDEHAGLQDRFMTTGRVPRELALRLGLTGMAARASGVAQDLRVDQPLEPYRCLDVQPCVHDGGDVAARVAVRFDEIFESLRLIRRICDGLPAGPVACGLSLPALSGARGLGWVEGWRGEVLVALELGEAGRVTRCHPHDPSWQNWPVLEHAVIGNIVPDFPLINKSFNLSYSGHDL